ncbi:hypothetical protein [Sphingobacterium sp.]|uniref:hypothetical protein n=1 Tax=Sphingobacterium sp. TaxID=341027 RepID=UPI0028B1104E|nr:hypothetical protein [Sphingobacterium sp.]
MEHTELHAEIYNDLADKIVTGKTFSFGEASFSESEKTAYLSFLKIKGEEIVVEPDEMLCATILNKMDKLFNQPASSGLKDSLERSLEVCYYFRGNRNEIRWFNVIEKRFIKSSVISTVGDSYVDLGGALELSKALYSELLTVFVSHLDTLGPASETLYNITTSLWDYFPLSSNRTDMLQNLFTKVVYITAKDTGLAEEYLNRLLKSTPYRTELIASVLAGILSAEKPKYDALNQLIADDRHHEAIAIALNATITSDPIVAADYYAMSETVFDSNNDIKRILTFFYQRMANNDSMADEELKGKCLQRIEQLCISADTELVIIGLRGLGNLSQKYSELAFRIIDGLVDRCCESAIFSSCLDVLYSHQSCADFFKLVVKRVLTVKEVFNASQTEIVLSVLYENHRYSFDSGLIGLFIDPRGVVRFAGVSILAQIINTFDRHFRFSIDLTALSSLNQYKLWVSLLDDDARVLDFMPLILPLLHSKNAFVVESLMVRIVEEIKNYGTTVYSTLENNIADDNPKKAELLSRVQKEMDIEFSKNDEKLKIRELDPRFTQSALLRKYYEIFEKRMSEQLEEQVDKSSIVRQLATTINLSKGGGYLDKVSGKVMELKKLAYEKQFPAKYFSDPENIDAERMNKILQLDWSKEFKECEAIISSYESTSKP